MASRPTIDVNSPTLPEVYRMLSATALFFNGHTLKHWLFGSWHARTVREWTRGFTR